MSKSNGAKKQDRIKNKSAAESAAEISGESRAESKLEGFALRCVSGVQGAAESFEKNSRRNFAVICILIVTVFALMYLLNVLTPFASDDFNYHFIYWDNCSEDTRIDSVSDIVTSMLYHYDYVNGRIVIHSLVELFALLGKSVFNPVNALMYVLLTLLIYKHCKGAGRGAHNALLYLIINVMLWLFVKAWGQTFVWMDGSINYMWGSVIRLSALLPFRLYADESCKIKNKWYIAVGMLVLSAIAGATNENTGAALVGMMALFIILYRVKKRKLPVWAFCGLAGALGGFAFMALAPANLIRNETWSEMGNSFLQRLINIPGNSVLYLAAPAAIYVAAAYLLFVYGRRKKGFGISVSFIYILGVFGGIYTMLAIPYFPTRVWFGITVTMIIAVGNLLNQLKLTPSVCRRAVAVATVFACLYCSMSFVKTLQDVIEVKRKYDERVEYIESEKYKGNFYLTLENIVAEDEHSPLFEVSDVNSESTDSWANQSKAAYYGVETIIAAK